MWLRGKDGGCPPLSLGREEKRAHSSWELAGFLVWVSSSQQPKLVDFYVLSPVSSAPLRSQVLGGPNGSSRG